MGDALKLYASKGLCLMTICPKWTMPYDCMPRREMPFDRMPKYRGAKFSYVPRGCVGNYRMWVPVHKEWKYLWVSIYINMIPECTYMRGDQTNQDSNHK